MASPLSRLPLRGLTVFAAAARHGRFTAAAEELGMTQARVSQHIAQLEAELGVSLFVRGSRGVQLTSAGSGLIDKVEGGLKLLADGVAEAKRNANRKMLQILTDFGFAAWWLMPRIALLGELLPDVEIRLAATQAEVDATDADFDLAIMFGHGEWTGIRATPLFREEVFPVCSPAYREAHPDLASPDGIGRARLLHLRSSSSERWFSWSDWFSAYGVVPADAQQELVLDNYQLVQQAALLGQGVCLGWTPLIDELVDTGHLVRLVASPLCSRRGYHIVEHADRAGTEAIEVLKSWLLAARPELCLATATPPSRMRPALPPATRRIAS